MIHIILFIKSIFHFGIVCVHESQPSDISLIRFFFIYIFTVSKSLTVTIITTLTLIAISSISQTQAKCCYDIAFSIIHVCLGLPNEYELTYPMWRTTCWVRGKEDRCERTCWMKFCADGSTLGFNCGVGECDMYACNCKGGCRKNPGISKDDLKNAWLAEHGLIMNITIERREKPKNYIV